MPTKQITVCINCGCKKCDGGVWKMIEIFDIIESKNVDLSKIPKENQIDCTLGWGNKQFKFLKNKKVGDKVELIYNNWVHPSAVKLQKIEE